MSYTAYHVTLSPHQKATLMHGGKVRITAEHLQGGSEVVWLTNSQANRIQKSVGAGHGLDLQMSKAQLRHNLKHGTGFFDVFKKIASKVGGVAKHLAPIAAIAAPILRPLAGLALNKVTSKLGNIPIVGGIASGLANNLANKALDAVMPMPAAPPPDADDGPLMDAMPPTGSGMRRGRRGKRGCGFIDDLLGFGVKKPRARAGKGILDDLFGGGISPPGYGMYYQ